MTNGETVEYGPEKRYTHHLFGRGTYFGIHPTDNSPEAIIEEALKLGWSNGCPRARYYAMESHYGADWMMKRYSEVNTWFHLILMTARSLQDDTLFNHLYVPRKRRLEEPMGIHEPLSVPMSHAGLISPLSYIEGYATPRVVLEIDPEKHTLLATIYQTMRETRDKPWNFLAVLSENAVRTGAEPERVLRHVYAQGVFEEQNTKQAIVELAQTMEECAPTVWRKYIDLSTHEKKELEIAEIPV